MLLTPTWCDCTPMESPTRIRSFASLWISLLICEKKNFHSVARGYYSWGSEVKGRGWVKWSVAAAVVHQSCPVPVRDVEPVGKAGVDVKADPDLKVGELHPQHHPALHFYCFSLKEVVWIVARPWGFWRFHSTCGNNSFKLRQILTNRSRLTLAATAFCWTKCWMHRLPKTKTSRRILSTSCVRFTATAATIEISTVLPVILAVLGSSRWDTKVVCWGGEDRTFSLTFWSERWGYMDCAT